MSRHLGFPSARFPLSSSANKSASLLTSSANTYHDNVILLDKWDRIIPLGTNYNAACKIIHSLVTLSFWSPHNLVRSLPSKTFIPCPFLTPRFKWIKTINKISYIFRHSAYSKKANTLNMLDCVILSFTSNYSIFTLPRAYMFLFFF